MNSELPDEVYIALEGSGIVLLAVVIVRDTRESEKKNGDTLAEKKKNGDKRKNVLSRSPEIVGHETQKGAKEISRLKITMHFIVARCTNE
jgi:hypothetical protein